MSVSEVNGHCEAMQNVTSERRGGSDDSPRVATARAMTLLNALHNPRAEYYGVKSDW